MAKTIEHDNGDVTVVWYGHEDMDMKMFVCYVVTFSLLMVSIIAPATVLSALAVALLGGLLGACGFMISLLFTGNLLHSETYSAQVLQD